MENYIIEQCYSSSFSELLQAAVRDYFADPRFTPDAYRYKYEIIGNSEETQGSIAIKKFLDTKIWIEHSYNYEQEAYPIIIIQPVGRSDREVSLGRFLERIEVEDKIYKVYGGVFVVDIRFVVVALESVLVASKICDHLRVGLLGPIKESLERHKIVVRGANPILTDAILTSDEWKGKKLRFIYSFDCSFRVFWTEKVETDLEYLVKYEGQFYLVHHHKVNTPIGNDNLEDVEREASTIYAWDKQKKEWYSVSNNLKLKVWGEYLKQKQAGLKPTVVQEFIGEDYVEGVGGRSFGRFEEEHPLSE